MNLKSHVYTMEKHCMYEHIYMNLKSHVYAMDKRYSYMKTFVLYHAFGAHVQKPVTRKRKSETPQQAGEVP